jgi:hypothetical protein
VLALFGRKVSEQGDGRKLWVVDGNVMKMGKMWVREMGVRKVKIVEVVHLGSNPSISENAENILRSPKPRGLSARRQSAKRYSGPRRWKRASIVERGPLSLAVVAAD